MKRCYQKFFDRHPGVLHFTPHRHHPWPDITEEGHRLFWLDSIELAETKWNKILGDVMPAARASIARLLKMPDASAIAQGTNTHELAYRLLSAIPRERKIRVLTTDSEFFSFDRQMRSLEESSQQWSVKRVACQPLESFEERFANAAQSESWDLIFFSHVFFDTGFAVDLDHLLPEVVDRAPFVAVDGYQAFAALPTDLSAFGEKIFYLGGLSKFAQGGEGGAFMTVPTGRSFRPVNTGWFADRQMATEVHYDPGGLSFAGSTFDASPWYRFNAVMKWWSEQGITVDAQRAHVLRLHDQLIEGLKDGRTLHPRNLSAPLGRAAAHLSFAIDRADALVQQLQALKIIVDARRGQLRMGLAMYHDESDITEFLRRAYGVI